MNELPDAPSGSRCGPFWVGWHGRRFPGAIGERGEAMVFDGDAWAESEDDALDAAIYHRAFQVLEEMLAEPRPKDAIKDRIWRKESTLVTDICRCVAGADEDCGAPALFECDWYGQPWSLCPEHADETIRGGLFAVCPIGTMPRDDDPDPQPSAALIALTA